MYSQTHVCYFYIAGEYYFYLVTINFTYTFMLENKTSMNHRYFSNSLKSETVTLRCRNSALEVLEEKDMII